MRTGLDARAAAIVMQSVKNVSRNGRTVMVTIHQPSIDIFEAFDALVLLQRGGKARSRPRLLPLPLLGVPMLRVPFICGERVMKKCRPPFTSLFSVALHRKVTKQVYESLACGAGTMGSITLRPLFFRLGCPAGIE